MVSSIYLQLSDDPDLRDFVLAALAVVTFMFVFVAFNKVYDLSTAMFVAFGLGLLARAKFRAFYLLYVVSCLNRETMFLLTFFFAIYYLGKLDAMRYVLGLAWQGLSFLGTRIWITKLYEDNPGEPFYFWPGRVLGVYWTHPLESLILIGLCALVAYFVLKNWRRQPAFLRWALVVILPLQIILHLALGIAFELRVFAEVFPIVWVMIWN